MALQKKLTVKERAQRFMCKCFGHKWNADKPDRDHGCKCVRCGWYLSTTVYDIAYNGDKIPTKASLRALGNYPDRAALQDKIWGEIRCCDSDEKKIYHGRAALVSLARALLQQEIDRLPGMDVAQKAVAAELLSSDDPAVQRGAVSRLSDQAALRAILQHAYCFDESVWQAALPRVTDQRTFAQLVRDWRCRLYENDLWKAAAGSLTDEALWFGIAQDREANYGARLVAVTRLTDREALAAIAADETVSPEIRLLAHQTLGTADAAVCEELLERGLNEDLLTDCTVLFSILLHADASKQQSKAGYQLAKLTQSGERAWFAAVDGAAIEALLALALERRESTEPFGNGGLSTVYSAPRAARRVLTELYKSGGFSDRLRPYVGKTVPNSHEDWVEERASCAGGDQHFDGFSVVICGN